MPTSAAIETNKAIVQRFLDGTHSGSLDVIDDTVGVDIVTHGFPGGANPTDRESYKQFFRNFSQSFTEMQFDVLTVVADTDTVAVRFRVGVTHCGPFAGIEPTGRRVSFTGVALYRLRGAKIRETWLHLDELSLLGQVGAIPQAAAA